MEKRQATVAPERVVLASSERGLYGGERQLLLLAEGLRHRGHPVLMLARTDGRLAQRAAEDGHLVHRFEPAPWPWPLWRIRRDLARFRPDVLHCNDARALTSVGVAGLGLRIRCRSAARRVNFAVRRPWVYTRLLDRLLCVSEAVRVRCVDAGLPPRRLALVRDAVDPARVEQGDAGRVRSELGLVVDTPVLLVVASLIPCKGHEVLLQALPAVWERHPRVVVLLAGDGALRERLESRAGVQPAGRLRLLGYREDIGDLLAAATAMVMPSLEEGFGSACAEASWCGVPVVASRVGGIPELLDSTDGEAGGWLVPPGDAPALAGALIDLLDRPDRAARRAARARSLARERHAPGRMVDGTLDAWRAITDESR